MFSDTYMLQLNRDLSTEKTFCFLKLEKTDLMKTQETPGEYLRIFVLILELIVQ